jgi:hypothetical protein
MTRKEKARVYSKYQSDNLTDVYVRKRIKSLSYLSKLMGTYKFKLKNKDIPPEAIEAYRAILLAKRAIRKSRKSI